MGFVQDVHVVRDLVDYAIAIGTIASLIVALGALYFAGKSASDSRRSAVAAEKTAKETPSETEETRQLVQHVEEQLRIQREEHAIWDQERKRRPKFSQPSLSFALGPAQ